MSVPSEGSLVAIKEVLTLSTATPKHGTEALSIEFKISKLVLLYEILLEYILIILAPK